MEQGALMSYRPERSQIFRIQHHRRFCPRCKDWKLIRGGVMKGTGKGMARIFYCAECK